VKQMFKVGDKVRLNPRLIESVGEKYDMVYTVAYKDRYNRYRLESDGSWFYVAGLTDKDLIKEDEVKPSTSNRDKLIYIYENLDGLSHQKVRELLNEVIENMKGEE